MQHHVFAEVEPLGRYVGLGGSGGVVVEGSRVP